MYWLNICEILIAEKSFDGFELTWVEVCGSFRGWLLEEITGPGVSTTWPCALTDSAVCRWLRLVRFERTTESDSCKFCAWEAEVFGSLCLLRLGIFTGFESSMICGRVCNAFFFLRIEVDCISSSETWARLVEGREVSGSECSTCGTFDCSGRLLNDVEVLSSVRFRLVRHSGGILVLENDGEMIIRIGSKQSKMIPSKVLINKNFLTAGKRNFTTCECQYSDKKLWESALSFGKRVN